MGAKMLFQVKRK